jgi:tetratricopeptide (TPR) repeat protein
MAYNNRGVLYKDQQKYELALADYNKAIELNPNDAKAYYNRGNLYSDQQKYELALADYNKAIELNPNYAEAYANRGLLYAELKQTEKAKIDLQQAAIIFRQQNNMAAYEQVMQILQQLGR